jgi:hypothetical protein
VHRRDWNESPEITGRISGRRKNGRGGSRGDDFDKPNELFPTIVNVINITRQWTRDHEPQNAFGNSVAI